MYPHWWYNSREKKLFFRVGIFGIFQIYLYFCQFWPIFRHFTTQKYQYLGYNRLDIKKKTALSDMPNQLMTKYTKTGKSTDIYSFSWIFSFKKSQKCWKTAKIPLPWPQILNVFIWSGSKNSLWRVNPFPIKIVVRNLRKLIN